MSREKVLSLLLEQGDRYVSGEAMSRALGISRAAVWKAIEALRQEGYVIRSAPNRGYRLENAPDRVREGELSGPLAGCRVGGHLLCLETIDSTNTEAKRQAMAGAPDGLVIVSEEQTGGRGRRGRSFQSPKGKGLYLTALLRPRLDPSQVADITAWVAVAVCDGIEAACGVRPQIKWTNDLVLNGKKLCGILTELGLESESNDLDYLITGIGINVNHTPEDFDSEVRPILPGPGAGPSRPPGPAGGGDHPGPGPDVRPVPPEQAGLPGAIPRRLPHGGKAGPAHYPRLPGGGLCRGHRRRLPSGGGVPRRPPGHPVRRRGIRAGHVRLRIARTKHAGPEAEENRLRAIA